MFMRYHIGMAVGHVQSDIWPNATKQSPARLAPDTSTVPEDDPMEDIDDAIIGNICANDQDGEEEIEDDPGEMDVDVEKNADVEMGEGDGHHELDELMYGHV
jgi:hypothetical protein